MKEEIKTTGLVLLGVWSLAKERGLPTKVKQGSWTHTYLLQECI